MGAPERREVKGGAGTAQPCPEGTQEAGGPERARGARNAIPGQYHTQTHFVADTLNLTHAG